MTLSTTNEIQITEGKTLKLHNVLARPVASGEMDEIEKIARMFESYTKVKRLTMYGPGILHSRTELNGDSVQQKIEFMSQVREIPEKLVSPYTFQELLRAENCLLAQFHGDAEKISLAYNKLQIYSFEHDLNLSGEMFTVILDKQNSVITADIFAGVAQ
ncbi:MAG TPA: hypothetical protein O0X70_01410 [Methanocorpusculum sp.]|nr:hypothetical protein [Methanocorpusculum sp.]